jgi:signal transduction histidine kinase
MSSQSDFIQKSSWGKRHKFIIVYNLLLILALIATGLTLNNDVFELTTRVLLVLTFVGLSLSTRINHIMRSLLSGGGVLVTSAALVSVTDGNLLAHFSFIISIVILASYREVIVYGVGLLVIFTYYFILGFWEPTLLINNKATSSYLLIVMLLVTIVTTGGASVIGWLLDSDSDRDNQALKAALSVVSLRQRQAIQIHDDVIQGLVVAQYAIDTDDLDLAYKSLTKSLEAAKELVGNLLISEETDLATLITRDDIK